ncbi:MAG: TonB-dependent receptor plug domain-containing protein [Bacteroidota bacterium]
MSDANTQLDVVTVEAEALKSNEDFILLQRKKSAGVIDGISAEKIAQTGDINAAAAIRRVTGVSIEAGKYVYVRGIGDRYTQTLLNGLQIPGLDPNRNTVQLDLIPSQLLDNIIVKKTFTPDLPGTSTGGTVNIVTSDFPDQFTINVSARIGYNSQATFNDNFITYVGGNTDWLGIDDGTRGFPSTIDPEARGEDIPLQVNIFSNPEAAIPILRDQTQAFSTNVDPIQDSPPVDHRFALSIGNQNELGNNVSWGYQASLSYVREYEFWENNVVELYQIALAPNALYRFREDRGIDNVLWGGLVTTGLKIGSKHKINANFMYNRSGIQTTIERQGELSAEQRGDYQNFTALLYEERELASYQLFGSHFIGEENQFQVEWSGAYTDSK